MRKVQKSQAEAFVSLLYEAHKQIKNSIDRGEAAVAADLLVQCQEGAISLGNLIESSEGEGFITVTILERYCELVYQMYEGLNQGFMDEAYACYDELNKVLEEVGCSIKNDILVRKEIVFMPYKASMWDSLESIWKAADEDPDCDAYVVPIPYYDRNPDHTFGKFHYEGSMFPKDVPITFYGNYNLEEIHPDVIYIHNPYDDGNFVTSVDMRYYSKELKKHTDCLVYVPYYATSGGMAESQSLLMAYLYADYIVMQEEKFRKYFDSRLPQNKLVALGSPKFDKVINMCKNPPEPPEDWKELMNGKKVYFYNTSIAGALADTDVFLDKLEYVINCFKGRNDACLLWRPHPLLETSLESLRREYKDRYDEIKRDYLDSLVGIYDDTPDITGTIALCDAYVGDAGTSVTSLFGLAGKPLFILNNNINTLPSEDDWRGSIITGFHQGGQSKWMVTQGNKLYHAKNNDYSYRFYCDLSSWGYGNYYLRTLDIAGKVYVCPQTAQDILVIRDGKIERKIELVRCLEQGLAFAKAWNVGNYIYLVPNKYPAIVRYNIMNDKIDYIEGYNDIITGDVNNNLMTGGSVIWKDYLLIASPKDSRVLAIHGETMKVEILEITPQKTGGAIWMEADGDDVWLLPVEGNCIIRWNPENGKVRRYERLPEGFKCVRRPDGVDCEEYPFFSMAINDDKVYCCPRWGNMFVSIDKETGEIAEWIPPVEVNYHSKNGYYQSIVPGYFFKIDEEMSGWGYYSICTGRLYRVSFEEDKWEEIEIDFDYEELKANENGFCRHSEWLRYGCVESAFNTLPDFLDGNITGGQFNSAKQIAAYGEIAANGDGSCGEKIHGFVCVKLLEGFVK